MALHATNSVAATIEELQFTLGEGPCIDAAASGVPGLISDLRDRAIADRWPAFLDEASKVGVRAVFAFPVRIGAIALGVMDLYPDRPGQLSPAELSRTFASVDLLGQRMLDLDHLPPDVPPDVPDGVTYPLTVHQAAGMVMVQLDSSIEEALVRLRATVYRDGRPVSELAADVVAARYRFGKEQR